MYIYFLFVEIVCKLVHINNTMFYNKNVIL